MWRCYLHLWWYFAYKCLCICATICCYSPQTQHSKWWLWVGGHKVAFVEVLVVCVIQYLHACLCFCVFVSVFVHLFVITGHRQVVGSGTMAKPLAQGAASLETVTLPLLLLHLYMHCSPIWIYDMHLYIYMHFSPIQYEYMIYALIHIHYTGCPTKKFT